MLHNFKFKNKNYFHESLINLWYFEGTTTLKPFDPDQNQVVKKRDPAHVIEVNANVEKQTITFEFDGESGILMDIPAGFLNEVDKDPDDWKS